jgi:hypothetical protein
MLGLRLPTNQESRTRVSIGLQLHVIMRHTEGMANMQSQDFEEWVTQVDRHPLNKSMRHMEDSGNIDSMMKLCDVGDINKTLHRD